jgi:beta-glucosidase-like glycosyl hydrolase/CubicO group peptidase (beta-lactamase class C family)
MRKLAPLLLVALLLAAHPADPQKSATSKSLPREAEHWVQATRKKMTLDEKVGQLLVVFYYGGFASTESDYYKELLRQVEQNHVGGFVVQTRGSPLGVVRSQVYPTAALANQLQRRAKIPLLVAADFERGTSMRLEEGTSFPYAMAVAATGNPQDAYTMGRITALEARAVGVHWIFAPVADVNINPENPIINTRSFGEDPRQVAEFVAAFVRGAEENGVLTCAKHFPGHGDTSVDSHVELSIVPGDRARLEAVELSPFRAAIAAGTSTIMTGHLAVPALEPNTDLPATLSPRILTDLLRKEMGFAGLIVTDALDMGGVTTRYPPAEVAVQAIAAGADVLLVPPIADAAITAVKDAVQTGRLTMARIDEAVTRILRIKARMGLHRRRTVDLEQLNAMFRKPEFVRAAEDIADRGVTLLRDESELLPLDATRPQRVLLAIVSGDPEAYPGEDFEREVRWRVETVRTVRTDTRFVPVETVKLPLPETYDLAIAALFVRVADRKGNVGLPESQTALVNQLLAGSKPVVIVSFGSPYLVERFPQAKTWVALFSTQDVAQRAAARALFGQVAIGGKIPVSVPGTVKLGEGMTVPANPMKLRAASDDLVAKLQSVRPVLERGVAERAFPGGVLAVGHKGDLFVHAFGRQTYDEKSPAVTPETIYDLASVTKAVVTATAMAMLVAANRVGLETPVYRYIPEFAEGPQPEWRKKVTVRQLLTHTAGLPLDPDYFRLGKSKREIMKLVFAQALESEPGTKYSYSNPGYYLLGEIVERITGKPLNEFAQERIFQPLGMQNTMFKPPAALRARIAPTENDTTYRKKLMHGEVEGSTTWTMGGVSGSAGLFATAGDLAVFCQTWLNGGLYAHQRLLSRRTIEFFTAKQNLPGSTRSLGFEELAPQEIEHTGLSARTYWHHGSTGTAIWIDPQNDLFVVLLTNASHPSAANDRINQVRPAVLEAIARGLGIKQ